jgi:hypothetical protein
MLGDNGADILGGGDSPQGTGGLLSMLKNLFGGKR